MKFSKEKTQSYLISITIHVIIALLFLFLNFSVEPEQDNFVTIGFGDVGKLSSPGALGHNKIKEAKISKPEKIKKKAKTAVKKVEVPKVKNSDETNKVVVAASKKKQKVETPPQKVKPVVKETKKESKGKEVSGEGEGNFGFEIDFGGKGKRKIYSYELPKYPAGVSKEIDVKLKFTILPDGTVGRIIPLIKADTRLEMAAINSLRQWRFEPLPPSNKKAVQNAVIVFPFRLQ
ncbi:transport protein TonB [bacterium BMS3Abin04]|nr:transport protein TonB [bacterium BMS3Abin04]